MRKVLAALVVLLVAVPAGAQAVDDSFARSQRSSAGLWSTGSRLSSDGRSPIMLVLRAGGWWLRLSIEIDGCRALAGRQGGGALAVGSGCGWVDSLAR